MTWLTARSGELQAAPKKLGSRRYPALQASPGRFVHQSA